MKRNVTRGKAKWSDNEWSGEGPPKSYRRPVQAWRKPEQAMNWLPGLVIALIAALVLFAVNYR